MDAPRMPEDREALTLQHLDGALAEFRAVSTRTLALLFHLLEKKQSARARTCLWYIVEELKRDVPGEAPRIMPYQDYRWLTGSLNGVVREAKEQNDPHVFIMERIAGLRRDCEVRFAPILARVETLLRIEEAAEPPEEGGGAPTAPRRGQQRRTRTQLDELIDVMGIAYPYGIDLLDPELPEGRVSTLSAHEPILLHCGNDDPQNVVEVLPKNDDESQVLYVENISRDLSAIMLDFRDGEAAVIGRRTPCDGIGNASLGTDLIVNLPAHGDTGDTKSFAAGNYLFVRVGGRIAILSKRAKRSQMIEQGRDLYTYNPFAQRAGTYGRTTRKEAPDEG